MEIILAELTFTICVRRDKGLLKGGFGYYAKTFKMNSMHNEEQ